MPEINSSIIQKYNKKKASQLLKLAEKHFNKFIRLRDTDDNGFGKCISSDQTLKIPSLNAQAGHFYSSGKYPSMKFNEDNVHLQGKSDNYFNGGNLLQYRKRLIEKIGIKRVEKLDQLADISKRTIYKFDRIYLIEVIIKYKNRNKTMIKR